MLTNYSFPIVFDGDHEDIVLFHHLDCYPDMSRTWHPIDLFRRRSVRYYNLIPFSRKLSRWTVKVSFIPHSGPFELTSPSFSSHSFCEQLATEFTFEFKRAAKRHPQKVDPQVHFCFLPFNNLITLKSSYNGDNF